MQNLVDELPDPVSVHYNPEEPAEAYLLRNSAFSAWLYSGFGFFALALGGLLLLAALMPRRE